MEHELKPICCPFCGKNQATYAFGGTAKLVRCEVCNAEGPRARTEEEALLLWNRRVDAEREGMVRWWKE
jgi:Lar family restriction alleviation protein